MYHYLLIHTKIFLNLILNLYSHISLHLSQIYFDHVDVSNFAKIIVTCNKNIHLATGVFIVLLNDKKY